MIFFEVAEPLESLGRGKETMNPRIFEYLVNGRVAQLIAEANPSPRTPPARFGKKRNTVRDSVVMARIGWFSRSSDTSALSRLG
jgi:hypothetical protein